MAEQEISGLEAMRRAMKSLKADPIILPSGVEIVDTRPIEPGDVVQLKSGGAKMTVTYVGSSVNVVWMYGDEVRTAKLPLVAVERYKKLDSPLAWAKYLRPFPLGGVDCDGNSYDVAPLWACRHDDEEE